MFKSLAQIYGLNVDRTAALMTFVSQCFLVINKSGLANVLKQQLHGVAGTKESGCLFLSQSESVQFQTSTWEQNFCSRTRLGSGNLLGGDQMSCFIWCCCCYPVDYEVTFKQHHLYPILQSQPLSKYVLWYQEKPEVYRCEHLHPHFQMPELSIANSSYLESLYLLLCFCTFPPFFVFVKRNQLAMCTTLDLCGRVVKHHLCVSAPQYFLGIGSPGRGGGCFWVTNLSDKSPFSCFLGWGRSWNSP